VLCRLHCEFGFEEDENGCNICKCKPSKFLMYKCCDDNNYCFVVMLYIKYTKTIYHESSRREQTYESRLLMEKYGQMSRDETFIL